MAAHEYDVLILGSGAAGLTTALHLDPALRIAILSKLEVTESSTFYAQGGVAAVLDSEDSVESHIQDTLNAGAGLCDENAVRFTVERAKPAIQKLIDAGVNFSHVDNNPDAPLHLTREGGHSFRRVIHAADATGEAIETTLVGQVRARGNIDLFEHHIAVDLITTHKLKKRAEKQAKKTGKPADLAQFLPYGMKDGVVGAYVLDRKQDQVALFKTRHVVLATGGASKAYLYTSNPDISTGDGIAMAWRVGCRIANMEFNQFHPTCLYHREAKSFLISEAVRGEGGKLLLPNGERFMDRFDERAELAPRDIVARAIDHEMKRLGVGHLLLDIRHKGTEFIHGHFPKINKRLLEFGIDMTQRPIPVVPAAHYTCGGVVTDLNGATDIPGLYAVGEVAHTGLHGANRMASNSLLECLVFATAAAEQINAIQRGQQQAIASLAIPPWDASRVIDSDEEVVVSHNWEELRRFMWDYVGIVRTTKRLERALRRVELLQHEIREYYKHFRVSNNQIELRNLTQVAELIIRSALARRESRGLHYTRDYPDLLPEATDTVLRKVD